jgi:hypothetical protein
MIVDVGEPVGMEPNIALQVEEKGPRPATEVSHFLAESMAGFLTYFEDSLAKSGIFAAYCAHGMLPVMAGRGASEPDGISSGSEYLSVLDMPENMTEAEMQTVADNAQLWYRKHSLEETAANMAGLILESPNESLNK